MCFSGRCEYEDRNGDCTVNINKYSKTKKGGILLPCPSESFMEMEKMANMQNLNEQNVEDLGKFFEEQVKPLNPKATIEILREKAVDVEERIARENLMNTENGLALQLCRIETKLNRIILHLGLAGPNEILGV